MLAPFFLGAVLAVGQSADGPPGAPDPQRSAPPVISPSRPEWPYPSGRTFAPSDLPLESPDRAAPATAPTPDQSVSLALPATLFPSPADQPAPKPVEKPYRRA